MIINNGIVTNGLWDVNPTRTYHASLYVLFISMLVLFFLKAPKEQEVSK